VGSVVLARRSGQPVELVEEEVDSVDDVDTLEGEAAAP